MHSAFTGRTVKIIKLANFIYCFFKKSFANFEKIYWSQNKGLIGIKSLNSEPTGNNLHNGNDDISSKEHFQNEKTRRGSYFSYLLLRTVHFCPHI